MRIIGSFRWTRKLRWRIAAISRVFLVFLVLLLLLFYTGLFDLSPVGRLNELMKLSKGREKSAPHPLVLNSSWWEEGWPREDTEELISWAHFLNKHHQVLNEERYGKLGSADAVGDGVTGVDAVIVVQVHDRVEYLAALIASLGRVRGIERALLIFSHDLVSEPINRLIRNITYARTIQLLYPYNAQLFPNTFPNITADGMLPVPKNSDYSIRAATVQLRHHFWWKLWPCASVGYHRVLSISVNYVVDGIIEHYRLHDSYVLCLEDDNLVSVDLLHVLRLMVKLQPTLCPECLMMALGVTEANIESSYFQHMDELTTIYWDHNVGLSFSAAMWNTIRGSCSKEFCTYDINGKDHALRLLSFACLPQHIRVMWLQRSPRVIAVHGCGVHHSPIMGDCKEYAMRSAKVEELLYGKENSSSFFPAKLRLAEVSDVIRVEPLPLHGWSDPLDHELCLINTHPLEPLMPPAPPLPGQQQQASPRRTEIIRQLFATKFKLTVATNSSNPMKKF